MNVSSTPGTASDGSAIAIDGATIYVAWREDAAAGPQIRLRRSTIRGATFSDGPSGRVVAPLDAGETLYTLRVAASGAMVQVLYTAGATPNLARARLATSTDGGSTFAEPITLRDEVGAGGAAYADLLIDGTAILHVVLEDRGATGDILYLQSSDNGATFGPVVNLSNTGETSLQPRLAGIGMRVGVVWQEMVGQTAEDPGAGDVFFLISEDSGAAFGTPVNLSNSPVSSAAPALAIGAAIHVAWSEGSDVVHRSSLDGVAFTPAAPLGTAPAGAAIGGTAIGSAGALVHASWTTRSGDGAVDGPFYRRSTDGGATFAPIQDLRFGGAGNPLGTPAVAAGSTLARLVWPHTTSGFAVDGEVLFVTESVCGVRWKAAVSGNWSDATKWSTNAVPGAGANVCIDADGAPYTVTSGNANAETVTIGHATSAFRPTLRITGGVTISDSVVNSGEITFGAGGHLASTSTSVVTVNTARGRFGTTAGSPATLTMVIQNYGEVVLGANITTAGAGRAWANFGSWHIEGGAIQTMGTSYRFDQQGGVLTVDGEMRMSSADFQFLGGGIDGFVLFTGTTTRLRVEADDTGEFRFRQAQNGELYGRLVEGQTVKILACCANAGNTRVTTQAGFSSGGTITLDSEGTATTSSATLAVLAGSTVVNTGTILVGNTHPTTGKALNGNIDNRGVLEIHDDTATQTAGSVWTNTGSVLIGAGGSLSFSTSQVFNQNGGDLTIDGELSFVTPFSQVAGRLNYNGGNIHGVAMFDDRGTLSIGPGSEGPGTFEFRHSASGGGTITGNIAAAQTIRLVGDASRGAGATIGPNSTNGGTIVIDSESGTNGVTLAISGTLTNTGTILVDDTNAASARAIDGNVDNRGLFEVQDGVVFQNANRVLTNTGTVHVFPGQTLTGSAAFVFNQNDGVLKAEGIVEMSAEFSTAGDTFNFNGGTVEGAVIIQGHSWLNIGAQSEGAGEFRFERNVAFGFSSGGNLTGDIKAAQTVRIVGTVGGDAQANVRANFTNFGTLSLEQTAANAGGSTLAADAGATPATIVNRGTLATNDTGPGKSIRGHLENRGLMDVGTPLSLGLTNGRFHNFADVMVGAGAKITFGGSAVFTQHDGLMVLNGPIELAQEFNSAPDVFVFSGGNIAGAAGVHLTGVSTLNIGAGAADSQARFVYRGQGNTGGGTFTGNIGSNMTLRLQGNGATSAAGFTNAGAIVFTTEAGDTTPSLAVTAGVLSNSGTITVEPTNTTVAPLNAVLQNHGTLDVQDTISLQRLNGAHTSDGVIKIAAGQTLTLGGNGTLRQSAPGRIEGGGTLTIAGGSTFFGVGAVGANVVNQGRVEPGGSPGILAITGDYTQTGRLEIEIQGAAAGTGYDRLNISGGATLGGGLDVLVTPGFCVEESYQILTYGSVGAADFAQKTGLGGLAGGRSLQTVKNETDYVLDAVGAPCNTPPVAVDDTYDVDEDAVLAVAAPGVLGNDTDVDGQALTAALVAGAARGTLLFQADGSFTYTPDENFNGTDSFTYRVNDGQADSGIATVTITVHAVADAPTALDDAASVTEDGGATSIDVLANDSPGVDGGTLVVGDVSEASHGTVEIAAGGMAVSFTPAADFHGVASFTYTVSDGLGGVATATVTVTVTPVNDAPIGVADAFSTDEDQALANASVLANDTDVDNPALTAAVVGGPAHGTLLLNGDGTFTYTPDANFFGADSFTYETSDGTASSGPVVVSLTIDAVNDAPVAAADAFSTDEDQALAGASVLANDTDVDNPALTAAVVDGPAHGTLLLNADGTFTYTPDANFFGADSFAYEASDGTASSGPVVVSLTIAAVNDAPLGAPDAYVTEEDLPLVAGTVLGNDTDIDGPALTAAVASSPAHGVLAFNADGSFTYTPNANFFGADGFTYQASDGAASTGPIFVSLTIASVNDAPTLAPVAPVTVPFGTPIAFALDAADVEGDALTFSAAGLPEGATLGLDGSFAWTPLLTQVGTHAMSFTVTDSGGLCATQIVSITVIGSTNTPPTCTVAQPSVSEIWPPDGRIVPVTIEAVTDTDGDPLVVELTHVLQSGAVATDATIEDNQALLRAARGGRERSGRVYEIFFIATDARGGSCGGSVTVRVPHDQGTSGQ